MQEINSQGLFDLLKPKTVLNIGAFDCADAVVFANNGCDVIAYEPMLVDYKLHPKVILNQCAISNYDGYVTFYPSENECSGSIHKPKNHLKIWPHVKFGNPKKVKCHKLDTVIPFTLDIDLIFADVNGAESELIEGAAETLKRTKYLFLEVSNKELYTGQKTMDQILGMLPGWELIGVYNDYERFCDILLKNGNRV